MEFLQFFSSFCCSPLNAHVTTDHSTPSNWRKYAKDDLFSDIFIRWKDVFDIKESVRRGEEKKSYEV